MSNTRQVRFEISTPVEERGGGYAYTITAPPMFRRPLTIRGETPEQARALAQAFAESFSPASFRHSSWSAPIAAAMPAAGISAAADGPAPFGDVVAFSILTIAVGVALYNLMSDGDEARERECEEQYDNDCDRCRRLSSSSARARCYASAMERKVQCLRDRFLPPLQTR